MTPQPLSIYLVKVEFGLTHDVRPCIIIEITKEDWVKIVRISSAMDLYNSNIDFLLSSKHSNFPATGLNKTSYASGTRFLEVPKSAVGKKLGILQGELAKAFTDWLG